MKTKAILLALTGVLVLVAIPSCELSLSDGQVIYYYGWNSSMGVIPPAEITVINQLTGIKIMTAYLVDSGTGFDVSDDLLGSFTVPSGNTNTVIGVPLQNPASLELTFSDSLLGTVVYTGLNTNLNDYDIYVRVDTGSTSPITPRSITSTVKDIAENGIIVTIVQTPR